ncbi:malto-oligosyltrehalose trehalohydrolase [Rhizobium sp. R72]|uniref:malto-oligosyltrehalose trehalohydrolase n=1 Tax=unclassified Rhizobium TaxID=2613769 RepID=UPI000B52ED1D|nr:MULTISPECIES: malto-oligosyltrehalose trehalohydrolase [unclassified Rhizobium]OWW00119.1 malto-oligosyltrehalose trehalohydrolase [Rhizobium sp. R72]OWW00510.1 malto-oligosyltrehalose trehalohydrolase [Rhizobium sp. R711]
MSSSSFGPLILDTGIQFRLWAPYQQGVLLKLDDDGSYEMSRSPDGWHRCEVATAKAGSLYSFILDNGLVVPDPASRFQPSDVHGPTEVVDLSTFAWKPGRWRGRAWEEMVFYELHIGTFTEEGTFLAAIDRLDHLRNLGITAVQIMPISDFPGQWGWGYDGVLPYAPDSTYGRPEHLKMLVEAAHERDICVFLDVVYNHFGPEGNYMPAYAPVLSDGHDTPWGNGINYDGTDSEPVRRFIVENAVYWICEFRLDGLRLDAVHAIKDDSSEHILHEIAYRIRDAAGDRKVHLIVENEANDSELLSLKKAGDVRLFNAQWNDDFHHALHVAATGETSGYYADYVSSPPPIGKALAEGFVFQGEHMPYRGRRRGKRSADLPATAFVAFIQNHDQIGNRALGDRVISSLPEEVIRAVAAVYLLSPQIPMLFMGEEWNAKEPFPYFCDFDASLREAVRRGRRSELARLPGFAAGDQLDPTEASTFEAAKLDWSKRDEDAGASHLEFYASLLETRRKNIVPLLDKIDRCAGAWERRKDRLILVEWRLTDDRKLRLLGNLANEPAPTPANGHLGKEIFSLGVANDIIAPWSVFWRIGG